MNVYFRGKFALILGKWSILRNKWSLLGLSHWGILAALSKSLYICWFWVLRLVWHSPGELEARGVTGTAALGAVWKGDWNEISKPDNWSFLRLYFVQIVVIIWPISSSGPWPVFLFSLASPRQKSQYLVASTWISLNKIKNLNVGKSVLECKS